MLHTRAPGRPIERREILGGTETRAIAVDGGGPPYLLLHGFADSADTWRPLLERFAAAGRRALAVDLTGFGAAGPLEPGSPLLPQWDRLVAAAISRLSAADGGGAALVAGNSLGGSLAIRCAQRPDLPVAGIVPIAPAGLQMARWLAVIEGERVIRLLTRSPLPIPAAIVRGLVGRAYRTLAFDDPSRVEGTVIDSFTRHIATVEVSSRILETGRRLLPELADPFELERVDCPLLLVWGDRDRMVLTAGAERVLRAVPYSDIEVIERCGHCPQVEVPDLLAELLLGFPDERRE